MAQRCRQLPSLDHDAETTWNIMSSGRGSKLLLVRATHRVRSKETSRWNATKGATTGVVPQLLSTPKIFFVPYNIEHQLQAKVAQPLRKQRV
jgi:hypothetical protein